jgi:2-dehydropantoate 2-reductase
MENKFSGRLMEHYNIAIIGAGPVGSIMAAYLARNEKNVCLIDIKKEIIEAVKKSGITLIGVGENFSAPVKHSNTSIPNLKKFEPDLIFIAVKFNYLDQVLDDLNGIIKPGQKIVLLQNGIDNEDRVAERFSPEIVLRMVVNYAGMNEKPGTIRKTFFNPPNFIGTLKPENIELSHDIARLLTDSGLETIVSEDIKKNEWKKTILNAGLMPICATTGYTMREAMQFEETNFLCRQILIESIQVAKKIGYEFGDNFLEICVSYLSKAGDHKPSTSLDLEDGNPLEYIFQPIIDYGKKLGSPTPFLESLTRVMRALEEKKRNPSI